VQFNISTGSVATLTLSNQEHDENKELRHGLTIGRMGSMKLLILL